VESLFDKAVQEFGTVDILMNNAGVDASGTKVAELSTEVWDTAIRTNLYGYFFCCRRFAQIRIAAGGAASSSTSAPCTRTSPTPAVPTTTAPRERSAC
jgi:NAD(P)-dependent dehydrogenase (short-subunit alcohol dehydrogenase family)